MTTTEDIREALRRHSASDFASTYLLEPIPHVFSADMEGYVEWKGTLGRALDVDPRAIAIVGSASSGFSLRPGAGLRAFGEHSDIDVAVVSQHHFELGWRALRELSPLRRAKLTELERNALDDHRQRLVYWGTIAADKLLTLLPFSPTWVPGLSRMGGVQPTAGRSIKARIYRDFDALRSYQMQSIMLAQRGLDTA
jgi:hypothetical protein